MEQVVALNFRDVVLDEWTDGVLVFRTVQSYCNDERDGESRTQLMPYGVAPPAVKSMRRIAGWAEGPRGGNRFWYLDELDSLVARWLESLRADNTEDRQILQCVQLLLRGSCMAGCFLADGNARHLLLGSLLEFVAAYKENNASLCDDLSSLSIQ